MRGWTHRYATINGITMHYVEQGEGPLVVLLHGFPHTWFSWRHQITGLAEAGYRVVAPDLRGMGRTDAPHDVAAYRADVIVADLVGLLDHLGAGSAVFSGLDFGMFAAYDLAIEHPDRVRGLIGLQNPFFAAYDRPPSQVEAARRPHHLHHTSYDPDEPDGATADYEAPTRKDLAMILPIPSDQSDITGVRQPPPGTPHREALAETPPTPRPWMTDWELETY